MRVVKVVAGLSFAALVVAVSQMHTTEAFADGPHIVHLGGLHRAITQNSVIAVGRPGGISAVVQAQVTAFRARPLPQVMVISHPLILSSAKITQLRLRARNHCGPHETAPRHFVNIDCNRYVKPHLAKPQNLAIIQKRHQMLLAKTLRTDSIHHADGTMSYPVGDSGQLADTVDHRSDHTEGMVYDQGAVGSCTAHSLAAAMNNAIIRQQATDAMSPLHIWSHYGSPDMDAASTGNMNKPITLVTSWPMDFTMACKMYQGSGPGDADGCGATYNVTEGSAATDSTIQGLIKTNDGIGKWQVTALNTLFERDYDTQPDGTLLPTTDMDMMASALAQGNDVWMAMEINSTAFDQPRAPNWLIGDYGADNVGGHAILFAGYRQTSTGRQWLIHNSWGDGSNAGLATTSAESSSWGDGGYAWIREITVRNHIEMAYVVTVAQVQAAQCAAGLKRNPTNTQDATCYTTCTGTEAVSPCGAGKQCDSTNGICIETSESCTLTDDDCSWDSLVDAATCQCALMCPDFSRENNGKCGS